MMYPIPFTLKERQCPCGCGYALLDMELMRRLLAARYMADIPFPINSWCRCKDHNKKVGGTLGSAHLTGEAVDISVMSSAKRWVILNSLISAGFVYLKIYPNHIHADINKSYGVKLVEVGTY